MDTTENTEKVAKVDTDEDGPKRFSVLVLMASILSIGSLAWSTWSFIDLYKVDALTIDKLGGLSLISLSAAATMDVVWSATMVAQYQGQKLMGKLPRRKKPFDFLPVIGWVEALFVAALLGYHGTTIGGGAAAFAAVLPVFTKLTWTMALNGLKDPTDLTDEEKAQMAAKKRKSRLTRADAEATAEQHEADMILKNREHEAALAEERRRAAIERERVQAQIEREKLERDAKFEAEKAELEGANQLKAMRQRLNAQLQIETMRTQTEITMERMDAEQDIRLRSPLGFNLVQGQVVSSPRPQLAKGGVSFEGEDDAEGISLEGLNLTDAERRKVNLAARYYAADAAEGGITKAAFAKANQTGAPRVTEATTAFPLEWFVENGLASWMNQG
jgi:hypothetical protein